MREKLNVQNIITEIEDYQNKWPQYTQTKWIQNSVTFILFWSSYLWYVCFLFTKSLDTMTTLLALISLLLAWDLLLNFQHTQTLHSSFKCRLTKFTNSTHFYSGLVHSQTSVQDLSQPWSPQHDGATCRQLPPKHQ
jgi:hypothetical protein